MIGYTNKNQTPLSQYQPTREVINITKYFKDEFSQGVQILTRQWEELNSYSVIERMNKDQRTFNSFVDESVEDPMEAWKWRGTRSMARNRAMALHAHITATLAVPMAVAQNQKQEEDRQMSGVMRDILEWMALNSEYKDNYILATMGTLVNPVTYLGAEFVEAYTTVKQKTEDGYETKEVLDQELSGFRCPVYSADQILITNAYEQNIQRQRTIIRRRYKDYHELESRWSWHPNWQYVTKGIKTIYSDDEGLFYDVKDDEHPSLVEEATGWCRKTDTEVTFLGGIYMGDDDVDWNAIKHRDNFDIPKVPLVPFGYERINEHFYFYKSLMNRVGWDDALIDAMYENTMNRETIDLNTPIAISGGENVDSQIIFPGSVVSFENPDAEARPIIPANRTSGYQALREIEKSMAESSISDTSMGQLPDREQKAYSVAKADQNAKTILRGVFRSIGSSVIQIGQLMIDIALQHITTAQLDEITGAENYRTLILQNQMVNGKQVSKKIIFDGDMVGRHISKKQAQQKGLKMLSEIGYPNHKEHIYRINPHLASKMKYMVRIEVDEMMEHNEAFEQAVTEKLYTLLRADPYAKPEALVRDMFTANRKNADEYMAENPQQIPQIMGQAPEGQAIKSPITPESLASLSTPQ